MNFLNKRESRNGWSIVFTYNDYNVIQNKCVALYKRELFKVLLICNNFWRSIPQEIKLEVRKYEN